MVQSNHEWDFYDKALAKKILQEKGIDDTQSNSPFKNVVKYEPIEISNIVTFFQYLVSILFPYVGVVIGVFTLNAYRTTPGGKPIKMYTEATRKNGWFILIIGIIRLVLFGYLIFKGLAYDPLGLFHL